MWQALAEVLVRSLIYLLRTGEIDLRLRKIGIFAIAAFGFMDEAIDFALIDFEFGLFKKKDE